MKFRGYTFFCLVIMTCYILRPVLPWIEYAVNRNYIASHLCIKKDIPGNSCHGKCHLLKQLQKSQTETPVNNSRDKVPDNKVDDHLFANTILILPGWIRLPGSGSATCSLVANPLDAIFVPPEIAGLHL